MKEGFLKKIISAILLLLTISLSAQNKNTINPPDHIKSIVLRSQAVNDYAPIVRLGQSILLEFDDLNADQHQYSYKIEHYDYNWELSNINSTEYIDGYNTDWIRNFEESFNTLQAYTHYRLQLPNEYTKIKISGNYMLTVLDENNGIVFSRPFIIYEPLVDVGVSVHRNRDIATINTKHSVQFSINHPNLNINNPSMEIKPVIYQNTDWNTRIDNLKPQFYKGSQLLYKYVDGISFWAGNEFLFFDTKQIRTASNNVAKVELDDIFHTYLYIDEARGSKPYTLNPDINGNFVIRTIDDENNATEADYSQVYFKLESFADIGDNDVYIYGNFNGWQLTDENKLTYNERSGLYEGQLLLKQGFYNYTYVIKNNDEIDNHTIEGSFYQTENDYSVLVYYKPFGSRYDSVIGYGKTNSENLRN